MSSSEAQRFADAARDADLSKAAYLAEVIAGSPEIVTAATRSEHFTLLAASNEELSTLSRNFRLLVALLSQGSVEAALEHRCAALNSDNRRYIANRPCPGMQGQDHVSSLLAPSAAPVVRICDPQQLMLTSQ
jgi:hypothetical protein